MAEYRRTAIGELFASRQLDGELDWVTRPALAVIEAGRALAYLRGVWAAAGLGPIPGDFEPGIAELVDQLDREGS